MGNQRDDQHKIIGGLILFAFYFVNYFVIIFFNSALIACAVIRFRGGDPTISDGLNAAMKRLPQIAAWALVSATVGLILRMIESRSERVGEILSALLGAAWSVATFFVVPILVVERAGPVQAVKRSMSVISQTWGEALSANIGIGLIQFLVSLPAIGLIVGGGALMGSNEIVAWILIACGVVAMIVINLIGATLDAIVLAALYMFATDDTSPPGFSGAQLRTAFSSR